MGWCSHEKLSTSQHLPPKSINSLKTSLTSPFKDPFRDFFHEWLMSVPYSHADQLCALQCESISETSDQAPKRWANQIVLLPVGADLGTASFTCCALRTARSAPERYWPCAKTKAALHVSNFVPSHWRNDNTTVDVELVTNGNNFGALAARDK